MSVQIDTFLRNAINLDAVVTGAAALLMAGGASFLAPLLGLPSGLLFWAGIALVPFVVLLVMTARREQAARLVIVDIVAINALWVAGSILLLVSGWVEPTVLGYAFVIAQAAAVALFAQLQYMGLKRSTAKPA